MKFFYVEGEELSDIMLSYMPDSVEKIDVEKHPQEAALNKVVAIPMLIRDDGAIKIGLMDEMEFYEWMK